MSAIRIFALVLMVGVYAHANNFEVKVQPGDRLVVRGLDAQIQFTGQPASDILRVKGAQTTAAPGAYVLSKSGQTVEIKLTDLGSKRAWRQALGQSTPVRIEIAGKPIPTQVDLHKGSVSLKSWGDFKFSATQGRFVSQEGRGFLEVFLQSGDSQITQHNGALKIDTYQGKVTVQNHRGDVEARVFGGQLLLEKVQGFSKVSTQSANSQIHSSTGAIQFDNGTGTLSVQPLNGRMEGVTREGALDIKMALDSEIDVRSQSGKVTIQSPANSGASVRLISVEGEIHPPRELKVVRQSAERTVRGRLRGDAQRGSVFVRSQDGTIVLK